MQTSKSHKMKRIKNHKSQWSKDHQMERMKDIQRSMGSQMDMKVAWRKLLPNLEKNCKRLKHKLRRSLLRVLYKKML